MREHMNSTDRVQTRGRSVVVITPPRRVLWPNLREVWEYRELVGVLAVRDLKVRYRQTLLGVGWAVLPPLLTVLMFDAIFNALLGQSRKPTVNGIPYVVSTYAAIIPWQLFARIVAASSNSLAANRHVITKVYFPRLVLPLAPIGAALVDAVLSLIVLGVISAWLGVAVTPAVLVLPCVLVVSACAALALSLWLSAINALYRDVQHAVPMLLQLWMFATPVLYTSARVEGSSHRGLHVLTMFNPMSPIVELSRWAVVGAPFPTQQSLMASTLLVLATLAAGAVFFRSMELRITDVV